MPLPIAPDVGEGLDLDPGVGDRLAGGVGERRPQNGAGAGRGGLDIGLLKQMLPMLAMAVAGFMAKGGASSSAASQPRGGGLGGMLGGLLGGSGGSAGGASGLASMLDLNGDGNPLDDILKMVGR